MITRIPARNGDDTYSQCVIAGDYIFLAHHAGGFDVRDIAHQTRACFESLKRTLEGVGATLDDMVQINYYIRSADDFDRGAEVFREYFRNGTPARMTHITGFLDDECLCMLDGIAYRPAE